MEIIIILKLVPSICILITTIVAVRSIDSWRREFHGKRQTELAEETLTLFYTVEGAIRNIRCPLGHQYEQENIERDDHETDEQYRARKRFNHVSYRYNQYKDSFNKLHTIYHRFRAVFGKGKDKPFILLAEIEREIWEAVNYLIITHGMPQTPERIENHEEEMRYIKVIYGSGTQDDPLETKIQQMINGAEKICHEIITKYNKDYNTG